MDVVYRCCCGVDVHKDSVTACVLWAEANGKNRQEKRKFGTFTRQHRPEVIFEGMTERPDARAEGSNPAQFDPKFHKAREMCGPEARVTLLTA